MGELSDFIDGHIEALPKPAPSHQHSSIISDVYYLLGDESLKSGENQLSCMTGHQTCKFVFQVTPNMQSLLILPKFSGGIMLVMN